MSETPRVIYLDVEDVQPLDGGLLKAVAAEAVREVERQDELARKRRFGGTHILPSGPDLARLGVLTEEVGEVAKECNESLMATARLDFQYRPDSEKKRLRKELIQVAACAIAWATALDEGR